jgi:hypothetical protein
LEYGPSFQEYTTSNWLLVVKKWANASTKNVPHFEHRRTSCIESSHAFIKSHLLGPQHSFSAMIKIISNALEAQCHKISALYHQQKITSLQNIGKIFHNCHGWITHYALWKTQNNLLLIRSVNPNSTCNGSYIQRMGIPCKHQIEGIVRIGGQVEPENFHAQWHIKVSCSPFFLFFPLLVCRRVWVLLVE